MTLRWTVAALCGALGLAPSPPRAQAGAASADEARRLDEIVVTGTRIRRIELEGPLPVTVIEREEIRRAGELSVSDAIRDLTYNSFGSFADDPTSDTPNVSLPSLRGLGTEYTLVLLDGHRLPGFAAFDGGAAASLTGIPMAAIERVEILRDGASAIYGSDAIGGVINLLTRQYDTAPEFELQIEQPDDEGGEAWRASFTTGGSGERAQWLLALETLDREPLAGADRDYLIAHAQQSTRGNPGSFQRIDPVTGRAFGRYEADPRCPAALDSDPVFPSSRLEQRSNGEFCTYRHRDYNFERAGYEGRSLFGSGRFDVNDSVAAYARVLAIDAEGRTQIAPSVVVDLQIAPDNPHNPTLGERGPGLGYELSMLYRLSALGSRVTDITDRSLHALFGVEGRLDWFDGGDWDASVFHNRQDNRSRGVAGFSLSTPFQQAVADGRFDPFSAQPDDPAGLESARYEPHRRSGSRVSGAEVAWGLDSRLWNDITASYAFGVDVRHHEFDIDADPQTIAGEVFGGLPVVPETAERDYGAAYGEMFVPLGPRWEASLAARYDHYEDAGGAFSPKFALAFRPSEHWLLRGSLGRGFQAPDLVAAYGATQEFLTMVRDELDCARRPQDPNACRDDVLVRVQDTPNDTLEPEHARQGFVGAVWQPSSHFEVALDYYRMHLRGGVGNLDLQQALVNERDCVLQARACDPILDGQVVRDALGLIDVVVLPRINVAGLRTSGIDLEVGARTTTALGDFAFDLRAGHVLEYEYQALPSSQRLAFEGTKNAPQWRASTRVDWTRGDHGASVGAEHVSGVLDCFVRVDADGLPNPQCASRIRSHTEFNAQWRWQAPWGGELAVGARNLAAREPPFDRFGNLSYGLSDPNGRVWYLRYRHAF